MISGKNMCIGLGQTNVYTSTKESTSTKENEEVRASF